MGFGADEPGKQFIRNQIPCFSPGAKTSFERLLIIVIQLTTKANKRQFSDLQKGSYVIPRLLRPVVFVRPFVPLMDCQTSHA